MLALKLLSVQVSGVRNVAHRDKAVSTGIFKDPVSRALQLGPLGLEGDEQADLKNHGGVDRAVYAYTIENYRYWAQELGRDDLEPGQFGENFTVEGMLEEDVCVGDEFRVGAARLQVTQPRVPCFKLEMRMKEERFLQPFLRSGRTGFYLRVLEAGVVRAGDPIEKIRADPRAMSVAEVCALFYFDRGNLPGARRALEIEALSPGWREGFEARLAQA